MTQPSVDPGHPAKRGARKLKIIHVVCRVSVTKNAKDNRSPTGLAMNFRGLPPHMEVEKIGKVYGGFGGGSDFCFIFSRTRAPENKTPPVSVKKGHVQKNVVASCGLHLTEAGKPLSCKGALRVYEDTGEFHTLTIDTNPLLEAPKRK